LLITNYENLISTPMLSLCACMQSKCLRAMSHSICLASTHTHLPPL